ncbi:MAG: hypothetical protein KIT20_06675 [Alphaproteobacteria bacterium]|nr:hypothetical protein [Alphaproteobacteria bacterium]
MPDIRHWKKDPAGNAIAGPINWSEGMPPSLVNDSARAMMADLRGQFEDDGWLVRGDQASYLAADRIAVPGDLRPVYHVGRRVRAVGALTGRIFGTIASVQLDAGGVTSFQIAWDGGTLRNEPLEVAIGMLAMEGRPAPGLHAPRGVPDRALPRFDGTSGEKLVPSGVVLQTDNKLVLPGSLQVTGQIALTSHIAVGGRVDESYGGTVVSGTLTNLLIVSGNFVNVSGNATIEGFGVGQAGLRRVLRFTGAPLLRQGNLLLPGGRDLQCRAGDVACFISTGDGVWFCASFERAHGMPAVVNRVRVTNADHLAVSASIPSDDTIPQSYEGTQILSATITPYASTSRLAIRVSGVATPAAADRLTIALFRDSGFNAIAASHVWCTAGGAAINGFLEHEEPANSVAATTFKVRIGVQDDTWRLNGTNTSRLMGGVQRWSLLVEEIP